MSTAWLQERQGTSGDKEEEEDGAVLRWLTSGDLKASVMSCVADLQAVLQSAREGGRQECCLLVLVLVL